MFENQTNQSIKLFYTEQFKQGCPQNFWDREQINLEAPQLS